MSPLEKMRVNVFALLVTIALALTIPTQSSRRQNKAPRHHLNQPPKGFTSLFNGKDLSCWIVPEGANGHWKVMNGVIEARSEHTARDSRTGSWDKDIWTEKSYREFVLLIDWRLKTEPGWKHRVPIILPDGSRKKDADGKEELVEIDDVDSAVFLRGDRYAQVDIWMWPVGSGGVYGSNLHRLAQLPRNRYD